MRKAGPLAGKENHRPARENTIVSEGSLLQESAHAITDVDIVAGMRRGESAAFEQFIRRFHRMLLDYAHRAGLPHDACDEFVSELLDDVAMQFMMRSAQLPRSPRMYLLKAFRNKLLNTKRGNGRRHHVVSEAARDALADCDFADVREAAAGSSEANVRASHAPDYERSSFSAALNRLASTLSETLSVEERQLLVAVAESVPQREIAEWLGVSYTVARKRLERVRARLIDAATRYMSTLEPSDVRELQRFFRRCHTPIAASVLSDSSVDGIRATS